MLSLRDRQERIKSIKEGLVHSASERVAKRIPELSVKAKNLALNDFEYLMGKTVLESTPEGIGIGAHYQCNARCVFCLGGKPRIFNLQRYKEFFEPRLGEAINRARYISYCGFGELFLMPRIEEFLEYISARHPDTSKIFTTNGSPLKESVRRLLMKTRSVVEVSLHADNARLHRLLTGMNNFDEIITQVTALARLRHSQDSPGISLVFIANTLNIENLPRFVNFAANLGADDIFCNYMTIFSPAHLKLSCFFKQELTNVYLNKAEEIAKKRNVVLRLPPGFGKNGAATAAGQRCSDPWKFFYVENEGSVNPCCYAGTHFGYLDHADFKTIWNGANYRQLRSALVEGPPHRWCKYCYKYKSDNVNDLRSHITFRPGIREKVLRGFRL